jgi:hypothetical protein
MRRGVVIAASSAYFLASAGANDVPALLHNAVTKSEIRLADDESKAFAYLDAATRDTLPQARQDASNVIRQGFVREAANLRSLARLVGENEVRPQAEPFLANLQSEEQALLKQIDAYASSRATQFGIAKEKLTASSPEAKYRNTIPERDPSMRGPLNFFRPEYGRWWLIEKTGDEHFEKGVPLAQRGDYVAYEALNFANGQRSILEIRDAISAEFEPVPVAEVAQFFEFLQKLGVVRLNTRKGSE